MNMTMCIFMYIYIYNKRMHKTYLPPTSLAPQVAGFLLAADPAADPAADHAPPGAPVLALAAVEAVVGELLRPGLELSAATGPGNLRP